MAKKPSALKIARICEGLTQAELAARADVNVDYLRTIELGRARAGKHFRRAVSGALGMSSERLFPPSRETVKTAVPEDLAGSPALTTAE